MSSRATHRIQNCSPQHNEVRPFSVSVSTASLLPSVSNTAVTPEVRLSGSFASSTLWPVSIQI